MAGLASDPTISGQREKRQLKNQMNNKNIKLPSVEEMLQSGVHFGHQVKRWYPVMAKFIYAVENKSHVIDLYKTSELLAKSCDFLYGVAKSGKQIVIVGTKRQASLAVEKYARECGSLFVNQRWLGGTFTNFDSIRSSWLELQRLEKGKAANAFLKYTKKEQLLIERKTEKLNLIVGGIQNMEKFPGAVIVVDVKKEATAVHEANAYNIPVVGIVDTNSNPKNINYVIPANDDAIKSIDLLLSVLSSAIKLGYEDHKKELEKPAEKPVEKIAAPKVKAVKVSKVEKITKTAKTKKSK